MKNNELFKGIFQLAIRLAGLIFLYHGLMSLPTIIELFLTKNFKSDVLGLIVFLWPLVIAWWMIGGATPLANLAYPENSKETAATPFDSTKTGP
jgi:hypothetical protein